MALDLHMISVGGKWRIIRVEGELKRACRDVNSGVSFCVFEDRV